MALGVLAASAADDQWLTDLDKAKAQAKQENKAVLMDFTGSDWCGFCIKLDKQVFSTKEFKEFAKKNLVLVEVDFPNDKSKLTKAQQDANAKLKDQFSVRGFPTIVVLDSSGKKLGELVGYGGDAPADYIKKLEKLMAKKTS